MLKHHQIKIKIHLTQTLKVAGKPIHKYIYNEKVCLCYIF